MTTQNEMMTVYYWQSGAWTDDAETAELAVECCGFSTPETIELDIDANVDSELVGLLPLMALSPEPETV